MVEVLTHVVASFRHVSHARVDVTPVAHLSRAATPASRRGDEIHFGAALLHPEEENKNTEPL